MHLRGRILLLFFTFPFLVFADRATDSLKNVIRTSKVDTVVVNACMVLAKKVQRSHIDTSLKYAEKALAIAERIGYADGMSRALSAMGSILSGKGDLYWSKVYTRKAIALNKKIGKEKRLADDYRVYGVIFFKTDEIDSSIHYCLKSLDLYEKVKDSVTYIKMLSNLGMVYMRQGNYDRALEYVLRSMKEERLAGDSLSVGRDYSNLGQIYSMRNELRTALHYYEHARRLAEHVKDTMLMSVNHTNQASVYDKMGDFQATLYHALRSLQLSELIGDDEGVIFGLCNTGDAYMKLKQYDKAEIYLLKAIDFAMRYDDRTTLQHCYDAMAQLKRATGKMDEAFDYQRKWIAIKDTIAYYLNQEALNNLTVKYDVDKKESQILLLSKDQELKDAELKRRRNVIYAFVGIAALLIALAVIVIKSNVRRKKANIALAALNAEISEQKQEVEHQKHIVDEKQKEILDSIHYAQRIQKTLLANAEMMKRHVPDHFVLFRPKDIVSGDFYWAAEHQDKFYLAVCDSTGHGVPGAFMCLLNIGFLSEAIKEKDIREPHLVFNYVRERLVSSIGGEGQKDGFDGILLCIDKKTGAMTYAAAHNAPVIVSNGQLTELPCDKMPVGKGEWVEGFTLYDLKPAKGDILYLYTDGYPDQFGGPKGKKFMYKKLNELLLLGAALPLGEQRTLLEHRFNDWRGNLEQVDDVCLTGIRIG